MNFGQRSKKTEKIISCFGKMTNKSTANVLGVHNTWVTKVWQRAGLDYETDEMFKNGYI